MNKQNDKQTALKLANHYADQYHILINQINNLKQENKDLRANLQINKDIIQGFFQKTHLDDKVNLFIAKMKEENRFITTKLTKKEKEAKESQSKITFIEQVSNTHITALKDEIEQLKTKTFLLENILIEKDNDIQNYKKKLKKHQTDSTNNDHQIIEIFITNPIDIVNKLNDRLELYMQINQKLGIYIQNMKKIMTRNDKKILDNEAEIGKLKQELNGFRLQKKNSTIIEQLSQYQNQNSFSRPFTSFNNSENFLFGSTTSKMNKSANTITYDNMSNDHYKSRSKRTAFRHIEKLEESNKNKQQQNKLQFDLTEEWYETLKHCAMTQDEYVKYCKNKNMTKLTDVIEYLYKLIIDKNLQIKMLNDENDCLNWENIKLNKINIELSDEVDILKTGENSTMINSHRRKGGADNSTFVNIDEKNKEESGLLGCYASYVKESMTSSEFREGMVLDQFDLESEMSKKRNYYDTLNNKDEPVNLLITKKI